LLAEFRITFCICPFATFVKTSVDPVGLWIWTPLNIAEPLLDGDASELLSAGALLAWAGVFAALVGEPVTVEDGREDDGALLEVIGAILTKLTGTVVGNAGAPMAVVGIVLVWAVFDDGVVPAVEAAVDAGWITELVLTFAAVDVFVVGTLIPALASVDATWV
jgi:hypothetical protein